MGHLLNSSLFNSYLGAYVYLIFKVWFSYLKIYYQLYTSAPYVNRAIHYLLGNLECLQLFFQKSLIPMIIQVPTIINILKISHAYYNSGVYLY